MAESPQDLTQASTDINHQVLSELGLTWAINRSAETLNTFGIPHGAIYATPLEGKLLGLSPEHLRAAVTHEVGKQIVDRCCIIALEVIDSDDEKAETRPFITYHGHPENMTRILAGLRAAAANHANLEAPVDHSSAS